MRAASKGRGIEITSISRPIRLSDFRDFDIILAMDRQNRGRIILGIVFKNQDFDFFFPLEYLIIAAYSICCARKHIDIVHFYAIMIYLFCGC